MAYDIIALSQLRWDDVQQRPHHLMRCAARDHRVFFVEEPVYGPLVPPKHNDHLRLCQRSVVYG